jgi:DNA modification methylase
MTNTIKIKCNAENTLELAELTEFQGGLKQRTDIDYDKIKLSICKYGFSFPFFVWKNGSKNYLLDGHGRFATLCKMQKDGYTIPPLPVVYVSCKDKKEAKEKLLRLNSQYGKMTKESVLEFCSDIEVNFEEIALPDTVIDFTNATEPQETEGDDEAPEVDEKSEPVSKRGEMYKLGNSILMCGDSTNAEDVARLMGGEKADMVFTDPPYNIDYQGVNDKRKVKNDKMPDEDFVKFLESSIMKCGTVYVCCSWQYCHLFKDAMTNLGMPPKAMIVWNKVNPAQHLDKYFKQHEIIFYYGKFGGEKTLRGDIWECKRQQNTIHPTMKPVELIEMALIDNPDKKLIYDGFGGSGSTLIACEKNNRKARLMELDPKYCDVIRRRYTQWAKENGKPITSGCLE